MERSINGNIQQQPNLFNNLFLILQAIQCYINVTICNHPNCPQLVNLFEHIRNCDKAEDCEFPKCIPTVGHMKHYLNCILNVCVCFKFGLKSPENELFVRVKDILLRNQFLIWRRKIAPFRPHLLSKISEFLAGMTNESIKEAIYHHISNFDDENFQKAKGISTYLTNLSKSANDLLTKIQINQFRKANPDINIQQFMNKVDQNANVMKIYNFLKKYSADVLHGRIKLENSVYMPVANNVCETEIKEIKEEPTIKIESATESPTNSSTLTPPKSTSSMKSSPEVLKEKVDHIWSKSEIKKLFLELHKKIGKEKDAEVFLYPVDWKMLEIPDYPKIITHPMDLSTICVKLNAEEYLDPWDVISDYWLMFNNAWTYNKKSSRVYKMCSNLGKIFEGLADELMKSMGLCCGREYVYLPQVLICCTPQMCVVNRDVVYYAIDNNDDPNGVRLVPELGCDKYVCCEKCFNESHSESVELMVSESTSTLVPVSKSLFSKLKNNIKEKEEFVHCKICQKRWHKVCAEHIDEIWASGFYCPNCESARTYPKQSNVLISSNLPHCNLSQHLEARIDAWRQKEAMSISKITIRVLSISKKTAEIKPEMRRIFVDNGEMPDLLPYKLKAIFAFQQQPDGTEICLFGMHSQEYGSDCPYPNARRIYLAYLDSVNFFEPQSLRTEFYHRLLIAYLEYCRQLGFIHAHIWACPPGEGDDYIFHMHPPTQKLPKPKRLQEWYIAMLDKAVKEGIVLEYADIFTYAFNSQLISVSEMPYFEGDYWPTIIEDLLKEDLQNSESTFPAIEDDAVKIEPQESNENNNSKKRKLKKIPSSNSKRRRQSDMTDGCNDIMKRLFDLMERRKENFFVVRLHSQSDASTLPEIDDKDSIGFSDLMDGRDKFLSLSREKHLEFSSLRRAKFATLMLCYELHLELRHGIIYSCNNCDLLLEKVRFTCPVCEEFELCETCAAKEAHPHKLQRIPSLESDSNSQSVAPNNTTQSLTASMTPNEKHLIAVKMLTHAYNCRDANCRQAGCHAFKKRIIHLNECQARKTCSLCISLLRIFSWHSKSCRNSACNIPFCVRKQPKDNQDRLRQLVSERRRMKTTAFMPVTAMVPMQPQQQAMAITPSQKGTDRYQNDIYVVLNYIEHLKHNQTNEAEFNRAFNQFLLSNPSLKESWQRYMRFQQHVNVPPQFNQNKNSHHQFYQNPPFYQQQPPAQQPQHQMQQSQHQIQQPQHQMQQSQHQMQQSQHQMQQPQHQLQQSQHQLQQYRTHPTNQPVQCYVVQTRPGLNAAPNQVFCQPPNTGQFLQSHSNLINTQFQNFNPS